MPKKVSAMQNNAKKISANICQLLALNLMPKVFLALI